LEALHARENPTMIYTGSSVPDDVRRHHPELIALARRALPARLVGELRRLIQASGTPSAHR
jgi:hypothetical protein